MNRSTSEIARTKVIAAAHQIFSESGFSGFTIEAVARLSGVAKTTIYRHWPSDNHLIMASINEMIEPFATPDTGSFKEDLMTFFRSIHHTMEEPATAKVILSIVERVHSDPDLSEIHTALIEERSAPMKTIIENAQVRGEIHKDLDPDLVIDLLEAPFFVRHLCRNKPIDINEFEASIDILMNGLRRCAE